VASGIQIYPAPSDAPEWAAVMDISNAFLLSFALLFVDKKIEFK